MLAAQDGRHHDESRVVERLALFPIVLVECETAVQEENARPFRGARAGKLSQPCFQLELARQELDLRDTWETLHGLPFLRRRSLAEQLGLKLAPRLGIILFLQF